MILTFNPYRWDQVNIDLFYGRETLRNELVHKLRDGQSFGVTGGRRMGKTTLLRRIETDISLLTKQWMQGGLLVIPVYIDTLALPFPLSAESIFDIILRKLAQELRNVVDTTRTSSLTTPRPFHPFAAELAEMIHSVSNYRVQVVFLFDEVEPILANDWGNSYFANWRAFLHNEPAISPFISAAFSGASEMIQLARDIGSPLGNVLTWRELALFRLIDASLLINQPVHCFSWHFTATVFQETGGHPFLIQYIMNYVCNRDMAQAEKSLMQAVEEFFVFERSKFERWWEHLPILSKQLYSHLAQVRVPVRHHQLVQAFSGQDVGGALGILCHTGVVSFIPVLDAYQVSGEMFNRWFWKFANIPVTSDLSDQIDTLLRELERSLRRVIRVHLEKKYGDKWLADYIAKIKTKTRNGQETSLLDAWALTAKCPPERLTRDSGLLYAELGDLFIIILKEWSDFKTYFKFGPDPGKDKVLFDERKDCLLSVRNALRHVRAETVEGTTLLKAQAFCIEMLDITRKFE